MMRGNLDPRAPGLTLRQAWQFFVRQRSTKIMFAVALSTVSLRLLAGTVTVWDAVVVAGLVAMQPMTEWFIHVYVLHFKPKRFFGVKLDFAISREHRYHHYTPHDPRYWFIPLRSGLIGLAMLAGVFALLMPTWGLALTATSTVSVLALVYEWTHYLCHSTYRPRTRLYKRLAQLHRLHHFKNEHYWLGVTTHAGDRLLGTSPDPRVVETSMTCRTLLGGG